jgi:hypothetical protein
MRKTTFVATAMLAALVSAAPLANAQGRHRGSEGDGGRQRIPSRADSGGSNASGNGGGGDRQRAERQAQPRDGGRAEQPRREQQRVEQPRGDNGRREAQRDTAPRDNGRQDLTPQAPRAPQTFAQGNDGNRRAEGRNNGGDNGRYDGRTGVTRYATPRTGPVPRYRDGDRRVYVQPRRNYYVYRAPSYRYYGGTRYYGNVPYYGYRYYDPYFAGDFYWSNHNWQSRSYYVGSSWDYGLGKLRLDIDQRDAEVYIDGYYAGVIDDFDGVLQGLRLEPGNYQVQVALPGFEPLEFDVRITPGRTTTYRGSLYPEP